MEKGKIFCKWWDTQWWLNVKSDIYSEIQIAIAFEKLRDVFGEKWIKTQIHRDNIHPLLPYLTGFYPFMLDFLVEIGLCLKKLEGIKGVDELIKNLRLPDKFVSFLSHIEIANWLIGKGFTIEEFEPKIKLNLREYHPDLLVKYKDHQFSCEIKTLYSSATELIKGHLNKKIEDILLLENQISNPKIHIHLEFLPRFWKEISLEKINPPTPLPPEVKSKLNSYAREIIKSMQGISKESLPSTRNIKGLKVIFLKSREGRLFEITHESASVENDLERGMQKISKVIGKQLSPDYPAIVGVKIFSLESTFTKDRDLAVEVIQNEFLKNSRKYKHVIGLMLFLRSYPVLYERRFIENIKSKL